jgi:ABC-type protease/lipase transport system fused ATPase/permease subunit
MIRLKLFLHRLNDVFLSLFTFYCVNSFAFIAFIAFIAFAFIAFIAFIAFAFAFALTNETTEQKKQKKTNHKKIILTTSRRKKNLQSQNVIAHLNDSWRPHRQSNVYDCQCISCGTKFKTRFAYFQH